MLVSWNATFYNFPSEICSQFCGNHAGYAYYHTFLRLQPYYKILAYDAKALETSLFSNQMYDSNVRSQKAFRLWCTSLGYQLVSPHVPGLYVSCVRLPTASCKHDNGSKKQVASFEGIKKTRVESDQRYRFVNTTTNIQATFNK
jgi:hypothetical protein